MLGWGFFIGIATLFIAPLFRGGPLQTSIRWVTVAFGVLSLISVMGFITETPLTMAGFIAWGPLLLALAILLTVYFRKAGSAASEDVAASA